jgi:hypothetical protein
MADLEELIKHLETTSGCACADEVGSVLVSRKVRVRGGGGGAGAKLTMSITRRKST